MCRKLPVAARLGRTVPQDPAGPRDTRPFRLPPHFPGGGHRRQQWHRRADCAGAGGRRGASHPDGAQSRCRECRSATSERSRGSQGGVPAADIYSRLRLTSPAFLLRLHLGWPATRGLRYQGLCCASEGRPNGSCFSHEGLPSSTPRCSHWALLRARGSISPARRISTGCAANAETPAVTHAQGSIEVRQLDLADLASVNRLAEELQREPRVDTLILNAGVMVLLRFAVLSFSHSRASTSWPCLNITLNAGFRGVVP